MSAIPGKAFQLLHATHLIQACLNKSRGADEHLVEPLDQILTEADELFLKHFLESKALHNTLTLISLLSRTTHNPSKTSTDKFHANLLPLAFELRPRRPEDRDCFAAFTETRREIENLLARATEGQYPDAQELYDILSTDFVRALLGAVDDAGNRRYTTYADQNTSFKPVYVEGDPYFLREEDKPDVRKNNLDHPFSASSLPQNDELSNVRQSSMNQAVKCPSEIGHQLCPPSDLSPLSNTWDFSQTSSFTSSTLPRRRDFSMTGSPHKPANNHSPHHSPGYRVGRAGSKHPALPSYVENSLPEPGSLRTVYINRNLLTEHLGITLTTYDSSQMPTRSGSLLSLIGRQTQRETHRAPPRIVIQRIIVGSLADKEGKLFPGDEIIEVNGVAATSLEAVQRAMVSATQNNVLQMVVKTPGIGQLKAHILSRNHPEQKVYIRCLFKYDPLKDTLLPSTNLGIAFKSGDVLELVDSQDLNWWQVRRLGPPNSPVGLVPSQTLQERRQAFNQQASRLNTNKKIKKVRSMFRAADSSNLLVRSDLWVYEEVVPWPPSPVPSLLLIGPNGVGRRTIKFLLCTQFPQRFSFPVSDTTDPTASTALFRIRAKEDMESDIRQGAYVEWGTVDGHHYGISFAAIREIISTGRTALIDCQCQSVYLLHQPEFNPHVVFVSAPKFEIAKAMMDIGIRENLTINKRTSEEVRKIVEESKVFAVQNQHLYTNTLVNSNMAESVEKLSQLVLRLEKQPGWIPASWAYEMSLPKTLGKGGAYKDRLPRLGIPNLPEDNRSVLGRATHSILSTASPESAVRLARPPSVCSSLQLPGLPAREDRGSALGGRWRYEKRRIMQRSKPQLSPLCSSVSSEVESLNSALPASLPNEHRLVSDADVSSKPSESTQHQLSPPRVATSNVHLKSIRGVAETNDDGDDDDDAISSTSSEDEGQEPRAQFKPRPRGAG